MAGLKLVICYSFFYSLGNHCGVFFFPLMLGNCSLLLAMIFKRAWSTCFPIVIQFYYLLQAFFTDTYMQNHPDDHDRIEVLKHLIALQVNSLWQSWIRITFLWDSHSDKHPTPTRSLCWQMESASMGRKQRSSWSPSTIVWLHASKTFGRKWRSITAS